MASLFPVNSSPIPNSNLKANKGGGMLKAITIKGNPPSFVSTQGRRIVAIGDLHGDLPKTRCALEIAGVLSSDGQDTWTGGETVLVQVGDILDRGEDEIAILSLLRSLNMQAEYNGGAVFQVNGNHETMNVEGDFRYVDPRAFDECLDFVDYLEEYDEDWDDAFVGWVSAAEKWKEERIVTESHWGPWSLIKKQKGIVARSSLFKPGGLLACELARHPVVLKVDDWVFCHGGLLPHHVAYGIERMNREVSYWMRGLNEDENIPEIPFIATRGYDSVVWNRLYSRDPSNLEYQTWQVSSIAKKTLQSVGARGMIVGHTPQLTGANCKHDDSIWCIDVGMSSGVLNSRPEVLEIVDNNARVLRKEGDSFGELDVADYL